MAQHRVERAFLFLLAFIPISLFCAFILKHQTWTFITSILAIIPLARLIGYATKEIALQSNPFISGIVNATFGNLIELIIAILALRKGQIGLVQHSIIGSIVGNLLLLIGLSIFIGGLKFKEQKFNQSSVSVSATMLIIAMAGLTIPSVYQWTVPNAGQHVQILCDAVAIILALTYLASLFFAFHSHKHLFDPSDEFAASQETPTISIKMAILIILGTMIIVSIESELLVDVVEHASHELGLTESFIGLVVIAIITNIAEKANAIHFALEDKIDIALEIGFSSAIQIALLVVPTLVVFSHINHYEFSLVFTSFELIPVFFAVLIVSYLSNDGKCNWLEGIQLVSIYLIIAIAFFFI